MECHAKKLEEMFKRLLRSKASGSTRKWIWRQRLEVPVQPTTSALEAINAKVAAVA